MALWREGQWRMFMWLILLEALAALLLLVGIVWWTMFSGRKNGERSAQEAVPNASEDIAQK
jgi:cytoskeletal protein RodZ